jgi:hypothetical protein
MANPDHQNPAQHTDSGHTYEEGAKFNQSRSFFGQHSYIEFETAPGDWRALDITHGLLPYEAPLGNLILAWGDRNRVDNTTAHLDFGYARPNQASYDQNPVSYTERKLTPQVYSGVTY